MDSTGTDCYPPLSTATWIYHLPTSLPPATASQIECKERTCELSALVAKEKRAFEESLRRFQEKGAALKAALETSQKSAAGNMAALKSKHQVTSPSKSAWWIWSMIK